MGKVKDGIATSVYLPKCWGEYRKICEQKLRISASARLSQLMLRDLVDLKGKTVEPERKINDLELEVTNLIVKRKKLGLYLCKEGVYQELEDLVIKELKLDVAAFKNFEEVLHLLLAYEPKCNDNFNRDDVELFIQLLELNKQLIMRKQLLDRLRFARFESTKLTTKTQ